MSTRVIPLLFLMPMIYACTGVANINVKDNVTFKNIEASLTVSENRGDRIRLRASSVRGTYKQSLNEGHILIGGTPLWSPTSFNGITDINNLSIDYGWDNIIILNESTVTFIYFGLQRTDFDLTLNHSGTRYRVVDDISQLLFEAGFRVKLPTAFSIEVSNAIALSQQGSTMGQIDLKMIYHLSDKLLLNAGYRFYDYNYRELSDTSDIILEFHGPAMGLNLRF